MLIYFLIADDTDLADFFKAGSDAFAAAMSAANCKHKIALPEH
jgi:hypothetical protein